VKKENSALMPFKKNRMTWVAAVALLAWMPAAQAGFLGDMINKAASGKSDNGPPGGTAKVESPENFKGITQVVMGQFSVAYFVKNVAYGGNNPFSSASDVRAEGELSGVLPSDYQATTNAVYADFKQQMATRGISIVDPAGYRATPARASLKPEPPGAPAKVRLDKSDSAEAVVYWPAELGHSDNVLLLIGGPGNIYNMAYAQSAEKEYAKAANIPVMNVVLHVDFAAPVKSEKNQAGLGTMQTVSATSRLAISHYGSQLTLISPADGLMFSGAKIILQSPIIQEGSFADVNGNDTNGVTRGLLGLAGMGGGMMRANFKYAVTNPGDYGKKVAAAANLAATLFLDQMQALR